jgi:hypothetical protein
LIMKVLEFVIFIINKIVVNVNVVCFQWRWTNTKPLQNNKIFHSATDFPAENPKVAIEANRC